MWGGSGSRQAPPRGTETQPFRLGLQFKLETFSPGNSCLYLAPLSLPQSYFDVSPLFSVHELLYIHKMTLYCCPRMLLGTRSRLFFR
jgi:hypothetical protein